jgi:two-component system cell cycle sensor histidine kinase/response regulator CckA
MDLEKPSFALTVLLVEDEDMVRAVAKRSLEQFGFGVVEAASAASALELCERDPHCFDVVVTDVVMPEMSGPALIDRLVEKRPDLRVLFISGYTDNALALGCLRDRGFAFLQKPFVPQDLVSKIRELVAEGSAETPR